MKPKKNQDYVLALDPGGSKCEALLLAMDGTALRMARAAEKEMSGRDPVIIKRAAQAVLKSLPPKKVFLSTLIGSQPWMKKFRGTVLLTEGMGALALAGTDHGVVVVAGTGAIVIAHTPDGRFFKVDGLGPILGDCGGGYQIGLMALRAAARATQHPRHKTSLKSKVFEACLAVPPTPWRRSLTSVGKREAEFTRANSSLLNQMIYFSLRPHERSVIASLVRIVDAEARAGDPVAARILRAAAKDMADSLFDLVDHLNLAHKDYKMIGTGSVAMKSDTYWREVCRLARKFAPGLKPMRSPLPPVAGVALAGLLKLKGADRAAVTARLFETVPKVIPPS